MELKTRAKQWNVLFPAEDEEALRSVALMREETGVSGICAKLFYNRGCRNGRDVHSFLRNDTSYLYDPFLMKDMQKGIDRLNKAVKDREKIVIYGDYDVDGVTSVTLLYLFLRKQGADVGYYIPSRDGEGYGVSRAAVEKLRRQGYGLMITVDTGITANEEIAYAATLGLETVVTDHHECQNELPPACAVINPHRPDCPYPFKELAGVGVVFKLICAYIMADCDRCGRPVIDGIREFCMENADLVAIGTIADVMKIVDENRLVVTLGLKLLEESKRPGIVALVREISEPGRPRLTDVARKRKITSSFIGFVLAPRLNAAGRISHASKAVELLLAQSDEKATRLARELCEINRERQLEENRIAEQASRKIEELSGKDKTSVIVLEDDNWQQGIIGIVASRITEKFGLPAILISFDGATRGYPSPDDVGKGSGRSVKGMNLVESLGLCEDLLVRYGGHELAAGLSIRRGDIPAFRERINSLGRQAFRDAEPVRSIEAECEVGMKDLVMPLMLEISRLEPFGTGNAIPNFIVRNLRIQRILDMAEGKHCKLILEGDGIGITAVWFNMQPGRLEFVEGEYVDVLGQLNINEYMNIRTLQLVLQDMKLSKESVDGMERMRKEYEAVAAGGAFDAGKDYIPDRGDLGAFYFVLRREAHLGHKVFPDHSLLQMVGNNPVRHINYVKLRFMMRILEELGICSVSELPDNHFQIDIAYSQEKTSIENSKILQTLRGQCREEKDKA
ncbi:MAG: single-stranded-DNA-specific exonuclease RecJ [Clostridia bacterium]|nr:single-stranded-DNA-specific exonuclease RecJ [Clostridia bacterium]